MGTTKFFASDGPFHGCPEDENDGRRRGLLRTQRARSRLIRRLSPFSPRKRSSARHEEKATHGDETVGSSTTVVDVHEFVDGPAHLEDEGSAAGTNGCDDFYSDLFDLIECYPHFESEMTRMDHTSDEIPFTSIECVLKQPMDGTCEVDDGTGQRRFSRGGRAEFDFTERMPSATVSEKRVDGGLLRDTSQWIQEPLLLCATPDSDMLIRRIRRAEDPSYFDIPASPSAPISGALPINTGKEEPGRSWVIDFETGSFAGAALFRIRGAADWDREQSASPEKEADGSASDYFAQKTRKFQMVIRGRFKSNVVMADCMSGLILDRRIITSESRSSETAGHDSNKRPRRPTRRRSDTLPSKWVLRAATRVAGAFSPRMRADLECDRPRLLSPLCSAAQTIAAARGRGPDDIAIRNIDENHDEPCPDSAGSLMYDLNERSTRKSVRSSSNYAWQRKRAFDATFDERTESLDQFPPRDDASPRFDTDAEYTFEFLQHLVDYTDLSLDLGRIVGKVNLAGALRGQPIRFVSAVMKHGESESEERKSGQEFSMARLDYLWSFDLWHRSLLLHER